MVTPFYNAVKGTTAGTPSTGAFTPNAASTGFRAWSTIPTGWTGLVRYEDGTAWELTYSYWNGTTLSRASTQVYDSSTGSQLTLTSAATAAMIVDASDVMSHVGTTPWVSTRALIGSATLTNLGITAPTVTGTAASATIGTTSFTMQPRMTITSATTASAQAGVTLTGAALVALVSTTAGLGGFELVARFGVSALPTGPRLFVGMTSSTYVASTAEPSALSGAHMAIFGQDSTDTNIQFITKNGTTASKIDTGITLAANGWYEARVWCEPGSNKMYGLLVRIDTGAIFFTSTTTNVPLTGNTFLAHIMCGLNGTNTGTAAVMGFQSATVRMGW